MLVEGPEAIVLKKGSVELLELSEERERGVRELGREMLIVSSHEVAKRERFLAPLLIEVRGSHRTPVYHKLCRMSAAPSRTMMSQFLSYRTEIETAMSRGIKITPPRRKASVAHKVRGIMLLRVVVSATGDRAEAELLRRQSCRCREAS